MLNGNSPWGALPDTALYGPYKSKKRPKIASEVTTVKDGEGIQRVPGVTHSQSDGAMLWSRHMDVGGVWKFSRFFMFNELMS